jgi:hypothetical protein
LPDVPLLGMLAAIHESAHAVCSYIHHQPIHSVAIEGQNRLGGTFRRHAPVRSINKIAAVGGIEPSLSDRDRWRQSLIALAAGRAAQRRFGARHEFYDGLCDGDFNKIETVARAVTATPAETRAYVAEIVEEAERFVEQHWSEIERVAKRLHAKGRLDETAISQAIAGT